ncbi:hypothetical protein C8J46_10925 [Sphingomonas sp. PP-F2F-A104-K0414]|nr:hypothetical protein C8J46_10925 [Sphingomonas sp. PP-F2F-A104-K0414]
MKYWTVNDLAANVDVPYDVIRVHANILRLTENLETDSKQCLIKIGKYVDDCEDDDPSVFRVILELAPGVVLPVEYGMADCLGEDWQRDEAQGVIDEVESALDECVPQLERLANMLHTARLRARKCVSSWMTSGLHGDFVDVRLATYDHWRGDAEPAIVVLIESIDTGTLRRTIEEIPIETIEVLEERLSHYRRDLERLQRSRADLMLLGASGTVNQLALNAMAYCTDEASALRRFATEDGFRLPDETHILMRYGEVRAASSPTNQLVEFSEDRFTIFSLYVPAARLKEAVGKPVTELVNHAFLTDDMIVTAATSHYDDGLPFVSVRLDVPVWLFCSVTGRKWKPDLQEGASTSPVSSSSAAIVPFPPRDR